MGLIYSVACKKCKVVRDLDKFYSADGNIETRWDAKKYSSEIQTDCFRAGLLVSFMAKHMGHECVFYNENSDCADELWPHKGDPDLTTEYTEDYDFWDEKKESL